MSEYHEHTILEVLQNGPSVPSAWLSDSEMESLNALPTAEVVPVLKSLVSVDAFHEEVMRGPGKPPVASRAHNALCRLRGFDAVGYLIDLVDSTEDVTLRAVTCQDIGRHATRGDRRAIEKLCQVLLGDPEPDVRSDAIEGLYGVADETVIGVLEYVPEHDHEVDWEGSPISYWAKGLLDYIRERMSQAETDDTSNQGIG